MNLAAGLPEEAQFRGGGQAQGQSVLGRWQLGHTKHSSVRLQEDGAQVGYQGTLGQLLQGVESEVMTAFDPARSRQVKWQGDRDTLGQLLQRVESEVVTAFDPERSRQVRWQGDRDTLGQLLQGRG